MTKKFLSKEGLDRVLKKIEGKFAKIDSPVFTGKAIVQTPFFEKETDAKEIVNKEYVSKMYKSIKEYIETENTSIHLSITIRSSDWKKKDGLFVYETIKNMIKANKEDKVSTFVRIDASRLSPEKILDVKKNCFLDITKEGVVYTASKPAYDLPIIINIFSSVDITMWLGGI